MGVVVDEWEMVVDEWEMVVDEWGWWLMNGGGG